MCDGKGNEALVEVGDINKKRVSVLVVERYQNQNEPERKVILYCSLLKRENFDLVVQKATEIGVAEIQPLILKRTIKSNMKRERLERIIKEASEQSGRGVLPVLHDPISLKESIEQAKSNEVNLFFHLSAEKFSSDLIQNTSSVGLFIGPEGGWESSEVELAKESGLQIVSIGKLTLRGETAAIVASFLCLN